jgi:two-component system nitrate/nitrite sensor histidine kinase NarX
MQAALSASTTTAAAAPAPAPGLAVRADAAIFSEIAAGLASGDELRELLHRFLPLVLRLAGAQAGAVRMLSDDGRRLELAGALGLPPELCAIEREVDRHCGPCGCAADGQPLVWAPDLGGCAQRSPVRFFAGGSRQLLAVPLQHRDRVLGVYTLFFEHAARPGDEVLVMLKAVGELLGLALNNARLEREQLQEHAASERQAMAADVHDALGQTLAFVKMRLPLLRDALAAHDDAQSLRYCDDIRDAVGQAHASLRGILTQLRSPMDPQGLLHALHEAVERVRLDGGIDLAFDNALPQLRLSAEREAQVFHVVHEALANISRHSGATHAWLRIGPSADSGLEIVVADDGVGLGSGQRSATHYGLEIMRERARRIGAALDIGTRAGGGTQVRLALPAAELR